MNDLATLAIVVLVVAAVWRSVRWIASPRSPDATIPHPLPDGFRLELLPRDVRGGSTFPRDEPDDAVPHVAVVVPVSLDPQQVVVHGEAGRWVDRRWSHPRERRIYAAAADPDVAARFAVRWFHAFHARLDEAESVMAAWNGPDGPLPVGARLAIEVAAARPTAERASFVAHLMPDRDVAPADRDATMASGVAGAATQEDAWPTASGATADAAARAVHAALLSWQDRVRRAHLTSAGWS